MLNKVCIIGQGNVGTHMCIALAGTVDELVSVSSRELHDMPTDFDAYIIAVSDSAIESVAKDMPKVRGIVAHTAGSISIDALTPWCEHAGVLYPLQTFTKWADVDYSQVPVFVEGSDEYVTQALSWIAHRFTEHVHTATSEQRKQLHIASIFASNFINHIAGIASDMLEEQGYTLQVLHPLLEATIQKLKYLTPAQAQTGPASRGDIAVVSEHLSLIKDPIHREIYELLSKSIIEKKQTSDE